MIQILYIIGEFEEKKKNCFSNNFSDQNSCMHLTMNIYNSAIMVLANGNTCKCRLSNCSILVFGAWAMSYVCVHVFYVICLFFFCPGRFCMTAPQ